MITISNLAMQFGGSVLFKQVDLQFTPGSCYGIIGANGAGKSTFLKLLSGELEPTSGEIFIKPGARMSVLKQDQNQYDAYTILDTVIMGNQHLYDVMKEKDALYEKPDFSEEDGMRASELEAEFADMDGWEAESDASKLLQGLGIPVELHYDLMANTDPRLKVKVLLAQALFGKPDIVMLDEPTNNLDIEAINWLEDFILDYEDAPALSSSSATTVISLTPSAHTSISTTARSRCMSATMISGTNPPSSSSSSFATRISAQRRKSQSCRPSSPALRPTRPRASRRPPAAGCSTR